MSEEVFSKKYIRHWLISVLLSLLAIGAIGYKWLQVERVHSIEKTVIRSESDLEKLLRNKDTVEFAKKQKPYRIPTGFYIQSLSFLTPSDVNITGYLWQKYPEDLPEEFDRGFIFPEEVNSGNTKLDIIYELSGEQDGKKYHLIGWYFDVTVRQSFDYSSYPLDLLTVWIRLWPKDFLNDKEILFVPDFAAYANTEKHSFGLDSDIVPGEWEIDETFFSYNNVSYDTDFGLFTRVEKLTYKEFYIELGMKRKFINAFIINLVPLFVVAILLFGQMMTVTNQKSLVDLFGFTVSGAIATCSALFFVVVLAHVQVRTRFSGSGLVYIEYFYLIMYFTILFTALNAFIFSLGKLRYFNLIHTHDNLYPKLAFWPVVLWMMALATWILL